VDAPAASTLAVPQGEVRFENVSFGYGEAKRVIDNLTVRAGEKIGLIGRSGASSPHWSTCCCAFMT
jgi:ATP-binding cassette subfamily B multidrug efflux pump